MVMVDRQLNGGADRILVSDSPRAPSQMRRVVPGSSSSALADHKINQAFRGFFRADNG